jgi:hypothetical protein
MRGLRDALDGEALGPLRLRYAGPGEIPEEPLDERVAGRPDGVRLGDQRRPVVAPVGERPETVDRVPFTPVQFGVERRRAAGSARTS